MRDPPEMEGHSTWVWNPGGLGGSLNTAVISELDVLFQHQLSVSLESIAPSFVGWVNLPPVPENETPEFLLSPQWSLNWGQVHC